MFYQQHFPSYLRGSKPVKGKGLHFIPRAQAGSEELVLASDSSVVRFVDAGAPGSKQW